MSENDYRANSTNQALEDRDTAGHPHWTAPPSSGVNVRPPSSISLGRAIARHPFLVILPAIFLLAAGIVAGTKKHPTYSASATINVGKSDIITQATPGYVQAAQVLATSYSRVAMSQHVWIPAAKALGVPVTAVSSRIVAVPVPDEPTFTITATGSSSQAAIALDNAAVNAVVKFANVSQTQQGSPSQLLSQYTHDQSLADSLHSKSASLAGKLSSGQGGVTQKQVTRTQVAAQVAALQAQAAGNAYSTFMENGVAPVLDVFAPAASATSNRTTNIEKYAVVGAVAGLVLGVALAALVGGLEARRDTRRNRLPA